MAFSQQLRNGYELAPISPYLPAKPRFQA